MNGNHQTKRKQDNMTGAGKCSRYYLYGECGEEIADENLRIKAFIHKCIVNGIGEHGAYSLHRRNIKQMPFTQY